MLPASSLLKFVDAGRTGQQLAGGSSSQLDGHPLYNKQQTRDGVPSAEFYNVHGNKKCRQQPIHYALCMHYQPSVLCCCATLYKPPAPAQQNPDESVEFRPCPLTIELMYVLRTYYAMDNKYQQTETPSYYSLISLPYLIL